MSKSREQFLHNLKKAKRQAETDREQLEREIREATKQDRLRDAEMYPTFGKTNLF